MFSSNSASPAATAATTATLVDQAAESADHTIQAAQRVATDALDSLARVLHTLRAQAEPLLDGATDETHAMVHRGMNALHDRSRHLKASARQASDSTASYIRHDPVKSMLIAAATGAALMTLMSLVRGPRNRG